jgi:hypothetical protein
MCEEIVLKILTDKKMKWKKICSIVLHSVKNNENLTKHIPFDGTCILLMLAANK